MSDLLTHWMCILSRIGIVIHHCEASWTGTLTSDLLTHCTNWICIKFTSLDSSGCRNRSLKPVNVAPAHEWLRFIVVQIKTCFSAELMIKMRKSGPVVPPRGPARPRGRMTEYLPLWYIWLLSEPSVGILKTRATESRHTREGDITAVTTCDRACLTLWPGGGGEGARKWADLSTCHSSCVCAACTSVCVWIVSLVYVRVPVYFFVSFYVCMCVSMLCSILSGKWHSRDNSSAMAVGLATLLEWGLAAVWPLQSFH